MTERNKTCCFFGHRDIPSNIKPELISVIKKLIQEDGVINFLVGNQGGFDSLVLSTLKEISSQNPKIHYSVVLAYLPDDKSIPIDAPTLIPKELKMYQSVSAYLGEIIG